MLTPNEEEPPVNGPVTPMRIGSAAVVALAKTTDAMGDNKILIVEFMAPPPTNEPRTIVFSMTHSPCEKSC
jgi:hypothetical protein